MASIHNILQGKGGVGKSFVAATQYQYFKSKGLSVKGFDIDPVNATFSSYGEWNVKTKDELNEKDGVLRFNVMKDGGLGTGIDPTLFDEMIDMITAFPEETHVIIDSGTSSFLEYFEYLQINQCIPVLQEAGHVVYVHPIMIAGQALQDCLSGIESFAKAFPGTPQIVWLNHKEGDVDSLDKPFEDFKIVRNHKQDIRAIIDIPKFKSVSFEKDIKGLYAKRQSYEAYIANTENPLMSRQRVKLYWNDIFQTIDKSLSGGNIAF